jgi:hypothetical protein
MCWIPGLCQWSTTCDYISIHVLVHFKKTAYSLRKRRFFAASTRWPNDSSLSDLDSLRRCSFASLESLQRQGENLFTRKSRVVLEQIYERPKSTKSIGPEPDINALHNFSTPVTANHTANIPRKKRKNCKTTRHIVLGIH